ncbi:radical SAM protein [Pyrococcus sp. NA2]|uniref:radical SAM protein n=1 Tax=Pyrococcus sp. (strain NA2) TaxID=342949 RepID=UPI0009FE71BC|nr:radical SAM protein [Pyrococcus sp. NA2]
MRCKVCGYESEELSSSIGVCVNCLRKGHLEFALKTHREWRAKVGLPTEIPKNGVKCKLCANECSVEYRGYCGVMINNNGRLVPKTGFENANVSYYLDPHPTNCVAEPVCPERNNLGYYNLAVFFHACNLDCLFCQNIEHKLVEGPIVNVDELVSVALDPKVTCICYFGGDPAPFSPYAIKVSRKVLRKRNIRICWETNGLENPGIMREMARLSKRSGGIVKIDWKAYTPEVYQALTGVEGKKAVERIKENIKVVIEEGAKLVVSTLVVPHYADEVEIEGIASFLASIDENIPYVLLAFYPHHLMNDVPTTSLRQMSRLYEVAKSSGLKNIFIGNYWLLR